MTPWMHLCIHANNSVTCCSINTKEDLESVVAKTARIWEVPKMGSPRNILSWVSYIFTVKLILVLMVWKKVGIWSLLEYLWNHGDLENSFHGNFFEQVFIGLIKWELFDFSISIVLYSILIGEMCKIASDLTQLFSCNHVRQNKFTKLGL